MDAQRLCTTVAAACAAATLSSCMTLFEPDGRASAPVLDGFGSATLQAGSGNEKARALFAQGMEQAYAFNPPEAVRAFKAALAQDPACVLCAWGVAWQLGPNINAPQRGDLSEARRYVTLAQRRAAGAAPFERALVDAIAVRYGDLRDPLVDGPPDAEICGPARPGRAHPLDAAYADRLRGLADAMPAHPDVISLYAEAEMIATQDTWWDAKTGRAGGRIGEVAERIERALPANIHHTGLNHYLIHAVDASATASRAVAAADRLGALAPKSPHLLHMPSHIYVKVGRFDDAARVNEEALAADAALAERIKAQGLEPVWNWDGHNLHFLWFAALMDGRGELALATARRAAERAAKGTSPYAEYRRALPALTLARLQRWDAVLREPAVSGAHGFGAAITAAMQGLALANTGQLAAAREKAAAVQAARAAAQSGPRATELEGAPAQMLAALDGWLQAELALRDGRPGNARDLLAKAASAEDEAGGEPPMLGAASRLALGDALLRNRAFADAETAFRDDLKQHPGNGWALRGLALALDGQGRGADAVLARAQGARAWRQADAALLR